MKILLASSEVHPFSKTGGLADMVVALGKSLAAAGHRVGIVTPLYRGIRKKFPTIKSTYFRLDLPLGHLGAQGELLHYEMAPNLTIYFVDQPGFYDRASLYGEGGSDYPDNAARFVYLSKCVVQIAKHFPVWKPDLVHIHDWQVGTVPLLIRDQAWHGLWRNAPAVVLTIHNLAYQGGFARDEFGLLNLPWHYFHPGGVEFFGGFNMLKTAIVYSDMLTTVSPRYAQEITTEAYGCGLEGILRARGGKIVFVRFPMGGDLKTFEDQTTPRGPTWDRLLKETAAPGVYFEDFPELASFTCPEWSHLSAGDSVEFTKRLVPHLRDALAISDAARTVASMH